MKKLTDVITFEGRNYNDTDKTGKEQINDLVQKLKSLENEILQYPDALISLYSSGMVATSQMPHGLQIKVQKLAKL